MLGGSGGGHRTIATVLTARDGGATDTLDEVEESGDRASGSMNEAESSSRGLNQSFVALAGATTALTGAIGLLMRSHGETEQQFARLGAVAGATNEELNQIRETALDVGRDLPISMGQAASAMESLSFAGFEAEESMAAIDNIANLSVASTQSLGQTARGTASALRQFNLEADQMHQVTASMTATIASSNVRVGELQSSLERVGATADMAGVSIQETSAALGVLADEGQRASRAGSALNTALNRIITRSGGAEAALNDLGISIEELTDEEGELRSLSAVFGRISAEMDGIDSQAERMAVATELAGQRGGRALMPLLDSQEELNQKMGQVFRSEIQESIGELARLDEAEIEGVEDTLGLEDLDQESVTPEEIFGAVNEFVEEGESAEEVAARLQASLNVSGEAAEYAAEGLVEGKISADEFAAAVGGSAEASQIAAEQMDTAAGSSEFLRSSWQALTFTVNTGAAPAVQWFNERLAEGINTLNQNRSATIAVGTGLAALTAVTGAATLALGAHIAQIKLMTITQGGLTAQTYGSTAAMWAWNAAAAAKTKATWLMTASTSTLAGALMAEINITRANVAAKLSSASATGVLAAAKGMLTTAAFGAAAGITAVWSALGPIGLLAVAATAAILGLVGVMKTDLFGAGDAAASVLGRVGDAGRWTINVVRELIGIVYELGRIGLTGLVLAPLALVAGFLKLPGMIRDVGPQAKEAAMNLPSKVLEGLNSLGPAKYAIPIIGPLWGLYDLVTGIGPDLKEAAMNLPSSIVAGLDSLGPAKYALPVVGPLLAAKDMITNPSEWVEAGKQIPTMIKKGIKEKASAPADAVSGVVDEVGSYLPSSDAEKGELSTLSQRGPALIHTVAGGIEDEGDTLPSVLSGALGGLPLPQAGGGPGAAGPGGLLSPTPMDQVTGSAAGGGGPEQRSIKLEIHQDIDVNGSDEETTEEQVGRAAAESTEEAVSGSDLDEFLEKLARETNN